jgi:glucokinase
MYLGIEIGGTKLQLGLGEGDGRIVALWRGGVQPEAGGAGIRQQILAAMPELLARAQLKQSDIRAAGIGFGGPTDDLSQSVIKSHQIAGWDQFPLAAWLSDQLGLPAVLANDADVAGLAEALFGAGKALTPIFYITIGSGIGGGLIVDGQIYRGVGRGAAEIGHLKVPDWRSLPVTWNPLENIASGWAIGDYFQKLTQLRDVERFANSPLLQVPHAEITAKRVGELAASGDELAQHNLNVIWASLAFALAQVITLLCPRRIVIGGGVSLMGDSLFKPLIQLVAELTFPPFAGLTDLVPAALGEEMVIHGALALARQKFSR